MKREIAERSYDAEKNSLSAKFSPLIQKILCGRGIYKDEEIDFSLNNLTLPDSLQDIEKAASRLADAIQNKEKIVIVGDYDVDGACAAALALKALNKMGAQEIRFIMPDRSADGYGLSEELTQTKLLPHLPALIITVDNGIKSNGAARMLAEAEADLIITDHHIPPKELPLAYAIINPKRADCSFPTKNLAGVGVFFYLLWQLRRILIQRRHFLLQGKKPTNLADFLDLVAIGTVADIVPMDHTNRILVEQGIRRIRRYKTSYGIRALLPFKGILFLNSEELSFTIIPKLNAVGRLANMELGVRCLTTDSHDEAQALAREINNLNQQRKKLAASMMEQALKISERDINDKNNTLCLYDANWHIGLIGPLAAQLKERYNCPVIVFADSQENLLTGSGRSTEDLCLYSLLTTIDKEKEGLLLRFGGHSQAVGLTIEKKKLEDFKEIYKRHIDNATRTSLPLLTDGTLAPTDIKLETVNQLLKFPWGKEFPVPLFVGDFELAEQELTSRSHLKLKVRHGNSNSLFTAYKFFSHKKDYPLNTQRVKIVYSLARHAQGSLYLNIRYLCSSQ